MCLLQKIPILDVTADLHISCAVTAQLNSASFFATFIVQSLYCIILKFQPSIHRQLVAQLGLEDMVGNTEAGFSYDKAHTIPYSCRTIVCLLYR